MYGIEWEACFCMDVNPGKKVTAMTEKIKFKIYFFYLI